VLNGGPNGSPGITSSVSLPSRGWRISRFAMHPRQPVQFHGLSQGHGRGW